MMIKSLKLVLVWVCLFAMVTTGKVNAQDCVEGQVRLVGGSAPTEGRVEVCLDQRWGTVCDDLWDTPDASVVCYQLGYSRFNSTAYSFAQFGQGSGPILLDDVGCTGSEDSLLSCLYDRGTSDCSHFEDAGVSCTPEHPVVAVNINASHETPVVGSMYSLTCIVTGTVLQTLTDYNTTYQWFKNGVAVADQAMQTLAFPSLTISDAGSYSCAIVLSSNLLGGPVSSSSDPFNVTLSLPAPDAVTVILPTGMIIAGSSPNLTCIVALSPGVDIPVNVTTVWSGPDVTFLPANPVSAVMLNITTYTSTVMIDVARNGSYTCQATVNSGGIASGSIDIIVAPLPAPTNLMAFSPTPTSIILTWEQPNGADAVDSYEISYRTIVIEQCDGVGSFPPATVSVNNSNLRNYTLRNSASTPVEEYSSFQISLTAVNSVTRSVPSQVAMTTTSEAAPGLVQSLGISSVNVTSITIQWDRVDCLEHNGRIDGYIVVYYPTFNPNDRVARILVGTGNNSRMFSVTGLPPRTSYTFEIQASNPFLDVRGLPAFYIANTTAPQDLGFLLDGQLYPNNSVVTVTNIGSSFFISALFCLTPSLECCSDSETPKAASVTREWYLPDGRPVSSAGTVFSREQVSSAVSLYRSGSTSLSGVYRCAIPDASGTSQNIYVGIYPQGDGSPSITSVLFERNSTALICTSTSGPPTVVTWRKDGAVVNTSGAVYEQSQRLVDAESSTYENVLFSGGVADFVGSFTCVVSNIRGTAQLTMELNGVSIIRDQFIVGQSATITCRSDTPTTRIEWLTNGVVLESATSAQQLDLMFSPVNDSTHSQIYTCRVTTEGAIIATQNFTAQINVPVNAVTVTVSRAGIARAGMVYKLTCNVSNIVEGLIDSPTATWTIGGVAVTNGNGITLSIITDDTSSISTLTFDPLRTSHDGLYTCSGILTSPALETPLMHSIVETLQVQISTPDVIIAVPPGPLFAGSATPLTLTCNISINSATDTDIAIMDADVTWLRGNTPLSNSDARVTISTVSGSRPSFTSTLTLNPLSTADDATFTCRARARPLSNVPSFITASEVGEETLSITIYIPSPPVVNRVLSTNPVIAGQPLTLTCLATIQEGISGSPTLTWTKNGVALPGEAGLDSLVLSFSSVHTSDSGVYSCTARLNISEAGVDVSRTESSTVLVQIPPPDLIITGSPRNTSFFQGLDLAFICSITLNPAVDTPVLVQGNWSRNGIDLVDGASNGRITVSNPPLMNPPYQITVRFSPLNFSDAGMLMCMATITPQDTTFIIGTSLSVERNITVSYFPTQLVDPITAEGTSNAGFSGYTLICNTSREPDLPPLTTLAVQWLDPSGNVITNGANISFTGSGPTTDYILTSRLTFSNLYTSQAGEYTCRTFLTIPGTVINNPESVSFTIVVKLPIISLTFRRSHSNALYAGTFFSLTCLITPNSTGVDTNVTVQSSFSIPRSTDTERVVISPLTFNGSAYEITVTFSHLTEDDTGTYNCSAMVASSSEQNLIIASDLSIASESISVGPLQPPVVAILGASIQTAGNQHTLSCTATVNTYLIVIPTIEWILPKSVGNSSIMVGGQLTSGAITTKILTFNPLHTSHGGIYQCTATVNISGIELQSQTLSRTFRVQVPTPLVSIISPSLSPYNGTNYTLTGMVEVDENVDTAITVSAVWSSNSGPQETISPPYLTSLTFEPLTPNNSREYTLSVTVRSSGSSAFIQSNSGSATYNLIVQPLPSHPPAVIVASRSFSPTSSCGEVTTLNCTVNQVENLFFPPTISWIAPDGRGVPVGGNNPRVDSQTKQLIFSGITPANAGSYACRATINIPEAQIVNYFDEVTIIASTSAPGMVENLVCGRSLSASELTFTWESPNMLQEDVLEYQVEVKELRHKPGTRDVIQFNIANFSTEMRVATVNQGLTAEVPYNITVRAINLAGCGKEQQIYCFTQEGVPPSPTNVAVVRFDSTTIGVSWDKLTLVELKGLANYIVTYDIVIGSRKRQSQLGGMISLPWTQNQVIISNLQPGAEYDITVRISTTAGTSAPVDLATTAGDVSVTTPPRPTLGSSDNSSTVAIIGGVVAVLSVLIIATAATIAFIAFILRNRKSAEFKPNQVPMPYEEPGVLLSDINTSQAYEIETIEADHDYEMLDKYNQAYEEIKAAPDPPKLPNQQRLPPSLAGDYNFSQCPAYVPVAHGNQQAETSLVQSAGTTAAKDSLEVSTQGKHQEGNTDDVKDDETYENAAASTL